MCTSSFSASCSSTVATATTPNVRVCGCSPQHSLRFFSSGGKVDRSQRDTRPLGTLGRLLQVGKRIVAAGNCCAGARNVPGHSRPTGIGRVLTSPFRWSDPSLTSVNGNGEMRHQSDCGCALRAGRSGRCRETQTPGGRRRRFRQWVASPPVRTFPGYVPLRHGGCALLVAHAGDSGTRRRTCLSRCMLRTVDTASRSG